MLARCCLRIPVRFRRKAMIQTRASTEANIARVAPRPAARNCYQRTRSLFALLRPEAARCCRALLPQHADHGEAAHTLIIFRLSTLREWRRYWRIAARRRELPQRARHRAIAAPDASRLLQRSLWIETYDKSGGESRPSRKAAANELMLPFFFFFMSAFPACRRRRRARAQQRR